MSGIAVNSKQIPQDQQSSGQDTIRLKSYFIQYNENIYLFHGVTLNSTYDTYAQSFTSTMMNFNRLTDSAKLNIKPKRISVKQVQRAGTVAEVLRYYKVPESDMKNLAILNNYELSDRINRGQLIKIIEK